MTHNPDKVLRLPKGNLKDRFLKYNMLKLVATLVMIFGGLYLVWGAYYGFFSKSSLTDEKQSMYAEAHIESTQSDGYYYYEIVKDALKPDEYNKIKQANKNYINIIDQFYADKGGVFELSKPLSKSDYITINDIQKEMGLLTKNIFTGEDMHKDVLKGDICPVIFEISNPNHHFIGKLNESEYDVRKFLVETRKINLFLMILTPLIPILGFLWLFFSAKHTYKRQQEYEKKMNKNLFN